MSEQTMAVIVPVLNEAQFISRQLGWLSSAGFDDCVVVDGGSDDGTAGLVARLPGVRLIRTQRGRGRQLNAGAGATDADILVFLHADTVLPVRAAEHIRAAVADPAVAGGCFAMQFDDPHPLLSFYAWFSRFDSLLTTFGDQAFFVRRTAFEAAGGFPDWPFLEDVEFRKRLRRLGRFTKLAQPVTTSARRYRAEGFVRRQALNAAILLMHRCGVPPQRLAPLYKSAPVNSALRRRADGNRNP